MKKNIANKIGIKDIARQASVSIGTVDGVLHNRGEVAEKTRQQVLKIIDEMGYTPNLIAKSLASKKKYIIAALVPDSENNSYWEKPLLGLLAAAQEIKKYNFELHIATFKFNNEVSFVEKSEELLKLQPNGLIFAPVFFDSSLQIVEKCEKLQLPYIFIDVYIENCSNLSYFGQNSVQSGFLAARLMNYSIEKGNKRLYIVKPVVRATPTYHLNLREKGFMSFFSQTPESAGLINSLNIDISEEFNLTKSLDGIFNSNQSPGGIFVANSRVHLVANYLKNNDIKNVTLIGYDLLKENIEFLENGTIHFLISQKPEEQGYKSVLTLFNYLFLQKSVEKFNYSPIDIIMRENIEYYKNFKL